MSDSSGRGNDGVDSRCSSNKSSGSSEVVFVN